MMNKWKKERKCNEKEGNFLDDSNDSAMFRFLKVFTIGLFK